MMCLDCRAKLDVSTEAQTMLTYHGNHYQRLNEPCDWCNRSFSHTYKPPGLKRHVLGKLR